MSKIIIEAHSSERRYWSDLWHYRELFYVLAWRDVTVKYRQTAIGVIWALLQPLLQMLAFTFIFGYLAKIPPPPGVPYALLVFAATLPWQFFSTALIGASQSLVGNANLISKVYFPRLIVPAAAVVTAFVDFLISFAILVGMMVWYHYLPTWRLAFLPFFILIAFLVVLGPGLLITALNVKYRDFRYIIPFITQFGVYISPVGFSSTLVPPKLQMLYALNPMVGVIDAFRWSILGDDASLSLTRSVSSLIMMAGMLWLGVRYFRRTERTFADVI